MPKKIYRPQFVFMNHKVIHGDPKPVQPVICPTVVVERQNRNPNGVKFK